MSLKEKIEDLNQMILSGQMMEAFEKHYHTDVSMQENSQPPTIGKDANREREIESMGNIETFHGAEVKSVAIGDDVTMVEWEMDVTYKGAPRMTMCQVAVQRWQDGQIIHERFYYSS
ncbi:SnoaL-like domain-containing protein [Ekhidna sp.]|uniref:SnoaL-like domain-containing protein n=1 Tax=Reichenbachiellaceae TaxID=2762302 RepID=UPI0035133014